MLGKKETPLGNDIRFLMGVFCFCKGVDMEKVCSFFGHRKIEKTTKLREQLINTVRWLITEKGVSKFLFGDKSLFDDFCQEVVKELKEEFSHIKRVYVRTTYPELGEPYLGYILRDFEDTCVPKGVENAGVARYVERNQAMINDSDYCIFYYNENYQPPRRKYAKHYVGDYQPKSGTALSFEYACQRKRSGKDLTIINLYNEKEKT